MAEHKYFAVNANHLMWMIVILVIFVLGTFLYLHAIVSDNAIKYERLEERVDWTEDQIVTLNTWKEKALLEVIFGKEKSYEKEQRKQ